MGKREACLKLCNLDVKKGWVTLKLRMRRAFSGRDKTFYPRLGIRTSLPRGKIKMLVLFRDQFTVVTKKNVALAKSVVHHTKECTKETLISSREANHDRFRGVYLGFLCSTIKYPSKRRYEISRVKDAQYAATKYRRKQTWVWPLIPLYI